MPYSASAPLHYIAFHYSGAIKDCKRFASSIIKWKIAWCYKQIDCQIHQLLKLQRYSSNFLLDSGMYNVCNLHKHYQHHVQFHVSIFFSKQVTTVQYNYIIFLQECFEISVFSEYMFISIKTTSPHKGNLRGKGMWNSWVNNFFMPAWDFWCIRTPLWIIVKLVIIFQKSWTKSCSWNEP